MDTERTRRFLLEHCARYPALRPGDLLKALHQSTFGCGHLVRDPSAAAEFIRREAVAAPKVEPDIEPLDGGFVRVHLCALAEYGVTAEELAALFARSAEIVCGSEEEIEGRLAVLLELAAEGVLPIGYEETARAVDTWRERGYPACHHSEEFRAAYAPAYRVLWREYLPFA